MPSVDLRLIGKKSEPFVFDYTWKDVALYALGVGASSEELPFVYEGVPGGIRVLPSFCVVPAYQAFPDLGDGYRMVSHAPRRARLSGCIDPFRLKGDWSRWGKWWRFTTRERGRFFI